MAATPISPKVTAGAATAAIVGLLLQQANSITPGTFAFLGAGQGLAFLVVTLALGALASWWKTDPLRAVAVDPTSVGTTSEAQAPATPAASLPVDPAPVAPPTVLTVEPTAANFAAYGPNEVTPIPPTA